MRMSGLIESRIMLEEPGELIVKVFDPDDLAVVRDSDVEVTALGVGEGDDRFDYPGTDGLLELNLSALHVVVHTRAPL